VKAPPFAPEVEETELVDLLELDPEPLEVGKLTYPPAFNVSRFLIV
jgi:hypothetical protein